MAGECDEAALQESYVNENLNINGARLKVYKLLGVHEQGSTTPLVGNDLSSSTTAVLPWTSTVAGNGNVGLSFYGIDFGINLLVPTTQSEYGPDQSELKSVGSIEFTQDTVSYARQVRVDIADGRDFSINSPNGDFFNIVPGSNPRAGTVMLAGLDATHMTVIFYPKDGTAAESLGIAEVGVRFGSPRAEFTLNSIPGSSIGSFLVEYTWKRVAVITTGPGPNIVKLPSVLKAAAVRIVPVLWMGAGNWTITAFSVLNQTPTDINNIQDLFFNENRDRDYECCNPVVIKAQYAISDSITDLSKFGLNMLDQYSFVTSFASMVSSLGRPLVTGDIIEVTPELQYDHNLRPIKKFVEVIDTGWAAEGFTSSWKPTLFRFTAQQAMPSQETRDIFGTMDTAKFVDADTILGNIGIPKQIDTTPLTQTEEIIKNARIAVPEIGSDDQRSIQGMPLPVTMPAVNLKGQPEAAHVTSGKQSKMLEDGLPPNGEPFTEGYALPDVNTSFDGAYFRLYYPVDVKIAPRLYRFSLVKGRWIFMEQDKRTEYSALKPAVQKILKSSTKIDIRKKTI